MSCPRIQGNGLFQNPFTDFGNNLPLSSTQAHIPTDAFVHHRCPPKGSFEHMLGINPLGLNKLPGIFASPPTNLSAAKIPDTIPEILKAIFTQLKDFKLEGSLKLPIAKLGWDDTTVMAEGKVVMSKQGRLDQFGVKFNPPTRYIPVDAIPLVGWFFKRIWWFPVLGALGRINLMEVGMSPKNRHIKAKAHWIGEIIPWVGPKNQDVYDKLIKGLSTKTLTGKDYDARKGLPEFPWQLADFAEKLIKEKGTKQLTNLTSDLPEFKPLYDKAKLNITADFSNDKFTFAGVTVRFAPLPKGQDHRITIKGNPVEPVMVVAGIKSVHANYNGTKVALTNGGKTLSPLAIRVKLDPKTLRPISANIDSFETQNFLVEATPNNGSGEKIRLEMKKGIQVKGLTLTWDTMGPKLKIKNLVANQVGFDGYGGELKSEAKTRFIFKNIDFRIANGDPYFRSDVKGRIAGKIRYRKDGNDIAQIDVGLLRGRGSIKVKPGYIGVAGNIEGRFPETRFVVDSPKIASKVDILVKTATVKGNAGLGVYTEDGKVLLSSRTKKPIVFKGTGGRVLFIQEPSKVKKWPELKKNLGEKLASKVVSKVVLDISEIGFGINRMKLENFQIGEPEEGGEKKPFAEITEMTAKDIKIKASKLYGRMFIRLLGYYRLVDIPMDKAMKNAEMTIGQLKDVTASDKSRYISFDKVNIAAVADKPVQAGRCGKFIQHIHVKLERFGFSPLDRKWEVEKPDDHFHIDLANPLMGGCLKIDTVPKKYPRPKKTPKP